MLTIIFLTGYLMTYASGEGGTDVVLSCTLVEEATGLDAMGKGSPFNRRPATLVLRDVAISPDQVPEEITPFIAPSVPDPDAILIEATVSSPTIPDVDLLLHADCNEQEVTCEISHYYPRSASSDDDDDRVAHTRFFIATVDLEGGGLSTTLVLQTLEVQRDPDAGDQAPVEGMLGMPLSQSGSLLTEVVFLVFSNEKTLLAPLGSDALLRCGFRQQEMGQEVGQEMAVEWWFQHQGRGVKVVDLKMSTHSQEHSEAVNFKREGLSVDASMVADGDASMTLQKVKVSDEGTYICTVHIGVFRAQQAVKLHAIKPPRVSLSEDKLVSQEFPHKLSCHCQNYYPMDAKMEWFSVSPDDAETNLSGQISLSGHRQHSDGTLSMSSYLYLEQGSFPPGTTLTCRVTHQALAAPINTSLVVQEPTPVPTDSYWMVLGFLLITVMFFYQLMK